MQMCGCHRLITENVIKFGITEFVKHGMAGRQSGSMATDF